MRESNHSLEEVSDAVAISNAYGDALQAISEGQVVIADFLQTPSPLLQRQFDSAVFRTAAALSYVDLHGTAEDHALIGAIQKDYQPDLLQARSKMGAVLLGQGTPTDLGLTGQQVEEVRSLLARAEQDRRLAASQKLSGHQEAQERHTTIVVSGLVLGLPIIAGLLIMVRMFERRETAANSNLERLDLAALTDSLTGLGNHRAYQERLREAVATTIEDSRPLSLAMIDVDEFKELNDSAGHARGDQVLFQLGRLLHEACGPGDMRFRVGGDEFAVIMPNADQDRAQEMMEHFRFLTSLMGATVSIGIAQLEAGDDLEILREKADSTLYTAKRRGRNTVCTFSGDNAEQTSVTQAKIKALRELLRREKINVAFQPVRESVSGAVMGYEALARIPAEFSLDGPQEAFDVADRLGRSHDLDLLCIREALRRARHLPPDELLFLNISPRTLDHAGFSAPALADLVIDAGLKPEQVCFEITERSTAPLSVIQIETEALRSHGFKIALDDVGAGNAGLEMMRRLKVDFVKIDRSVLIGAIGRGPGRAVLLAIIVFASEAGAVVIAEGIETMEMLAVIQEMNRGPFTVQGVQGYILGEPERGFATEFDLPLSA